MKIILCILIGYLLGSLSPAALIAKIKQTSLRHNGTGNLGATNTALLFGKALGGLVMVLDIGKACLAVWCARWITPDPAWLGMLTGAFAVLGHCFPFYLRFKGGKGLAAFGGVILAFHPLLFAILLTTGTLLVLITNCGTALAYYVAAVFPVFIWITGQNLPEKIICTILALFIMVLFIPNLIRALKGRDATPTHFIQKHLRKGAKK